MQRGVGRDVPKFEKFTDALEASGLDADTSSTRVHSFARRAGPRPRQLALVAAHWSTITADDVRSVLTALPDVAQVLKSANPARKAELYADLGVRLTTGPTAER